MEVVDGNAEQCLYHWEKECIGATEVHLGLGTAVWSVLFQVEQR
jgi:hypothetical protein